jgi:hypothetical protein
MIKSMACSKLLAGDGFARGAVINFNCRIASGEQSGL